MKVKTGKVEKNIQCELRSGSVRFSVEVYPLKKSQLTFDLDEYEQGLMWARRERVALLEQKAAAKAPVAPPAPVLEPGTTPDHVFIKDILDNYRVNVLPALAGAAADRSRLKRLDEWFGHLTIRELKKPVLTKWLADRTDGLLGSGRSSDPKLTKHERYALKKAGEAEKVKPLPLVKPSSQTMRHELVLMRRALTSYLHTHDLFEAHAMWLASQPIMRFDLPDQSKPRTVRVNETGLAALLGHVDNPAQRAYIGLAIMTTLRRGEMCSLEWSDIDLTRNVVTLKAPGHERKTKVVAREIPLLPPAVDVLKRYGVKSEGKLFPITPSGISQAFRRAADKAGLSKLRLHDLRREGISRMRDRLGASLEDIAVFSGHQDILTLQKHYVNENAELVGNRMAQHPAMDKMMSAT
jgi:integrase